MNAAQQRHRRKILRAVRLCAWCSKRPLAAASLCESCAEKNRARCLARYYRLQEAKAQP